jgi:hypothetical protein
MKPLFTLLKKIDLHLDRHVPFLVLLALLVILRLPNFFEPYWYGDEGIYLTIGTALRQGSRLYAEIIDHKTPLIYYLAMTPTQLWFRVLLLVWMSVTTWFFYQLCVFFFDKRWQAFVTTLIFVLLTTLPLYEGNIPNGELFVMGFVIVAGWLLTHTEWGRGLRSEANPQSRSESGRFDVVFLGLAGVFFSLGILTKVPALFDLLAFLSLGWFGVADIFEQKYVSSTGGRTRLLTRWSRAFSATLTTTHFWRYFRQGVLILIAVVVPILLSVLYYVLRGSGQAYLDYGLLYNFRYAGSWALPFTNPLLLFLFTLPGKVLFLAVFGLLITSARRWLVTRWQFAALWLGLSLVAATLSNRPYPHYFLQLVPPLCLLIGLGTSLITEGLGRQLSIKILAARVALFISLLLVLVSTAALLRVGVYPTLSYYQRWYRMMTGQISKIEYRDSFNHLLHDNYTAAQIINKTHPDKLFIWGTNPMLYALTQTSPTGRFTVSFHIHDFQAYEETLRDLKQHHPPFIVVMKDETQPLPGLGEYLAEFYMPNNDFTYFTLWKLRSTQNTSQPEVY